MESRSHLDGGTALHAEDVVVQFGGVRAVDRVSLTLHRGDVLGLIGPNGAGKTTLINALTGFQRVASGRVMLGVRDATKWQPALWARNGVARTFQGVRLFGELTAFENVQAGALGVGMNRREASRLATTLLERLELQARASVRAASLPHGDERRLGLARALATRPHLLLLDEPAAGLNEVESEQLLSFLSEIRGEHGIGLLVIEHDMRLIMRLCEQIQVLDYGKTIALGTPEAIRSDARVLSAYLGAPDEDGSA